MFRQTTRLCAALAVLAAPLTVHAAPVYTVNLVPNPEGAIYTEARAINNAGDIAGYSQRTYSSPWSASAAVGGTARYVSNAIAQDSIAYGINDSGMIVGTVTLYSGYSRATIFAGNGVGYITPQEGSYTSEATAVNARGQVVGSTNLGLDSFGSHAFLSQGGSLIDLGTLAGGTTSRAMDINDNGVITGYSSTGSGTHAFIYQNGVMTDIGSLGGSSYGYAINDAGVVTGDYYVSGNTRHAFVYANGQMIDLGTLGGNSLGRDINEAGQVVGVSSVGNNTRAFLYSDGQMLDLNTLIDPTLGWTLTTANSINDKGQIAASGCRVNGACGSVILSLAQADVPEPEAFTAGIAGLALFGLARRRQRKQG